MQIGCEKAKKKIREKFFINRELAFLVINFCKGLGSNLKSVVDSRQANLRKRVHVVRNLNNRHYFLWNAKLASFRKQRKRAGEQQQKGPLLDLLVESQTSFLFLCPLLDTREP